MSPEAEHAIETVRLAMQLADDKITAGELRDCIRKLYGEKVDEEIKDFFHPSTQQ